MPGRKAGGAGGAAIFPLSSLGGTIKLVLDIESGMTVLLSVETAAASAGLEAA